MRRRRGGSLCRGDEANSGFAEFIDGGAIRATVLGNEGRLSSFIQNEDDHVAPPHVLRGEIETPTRAERRAAS